MMLLAAVMLLALLLYYWYSVAYSRPEHQWLWKGLPYSGDATRVVVCGSCGSGKSTSCRALSDRLGVAFLSLDELAWLPGWQMRDVYEFQKLVREFLSSEKTEKHGFAIDGNWRAVQPLYLAETQLVLWLDYPLVVTLWWLLKRCISRYWYQTPCCNNNRETLWNHFYSYNESLFVWAVKAKYISVPRYERLWESQKHSHLSIYRFKSPAELYSFINQMPRRRVLDERKLN